MVCLLYDLQSGWFSPVVSGEARDLETGPGNCNCVTCIAERFSAVRIAFSRTYLTRA